MTTTHRQPTRAKEITAITGLISGAEKRLPALTEVMLGGVTIPMATLLGDLQGLLGRIAAVTAARALLEQSLQALDVEGPPVRARASAFAAYVRLTFGNQADVLADFAMAPRKIPPARTLEQKKAIAAKALATRKARGTVGPKARKAITGATAAQAEKG